MSEQKKKNANAPSGIKEFFRKQLVSLKRKPQNIPFLVLIITFLIYSLRLRMVSDTTARIMGAGMGFTGFVTMLFSMLSLVTFLNSFPHRKKVNIPMLSLFFIMQVIIVVCDEYYLGRIKAALRNSGDMVGMLTKSPFILKAYNMLNTHVIFVIVTIVLTALLPLYSRLIRKINTSIEVEGNGDMAEIDISGEE